MCGVVSGGGVAGLVSWVTPGLHQLSLEPRALRKGRPALPWASVIVMASSSLSQWSSFPGVCVQSIIGAKGNSHSCQEP